MKLLQMFRNQWLSIALALLNIALIVFVVLPGRPPHRPPGDVSEQWRRELHLDEAQTARFRDSYERHRAVSEPLFRKMHDLRRQIIESAADSSAVAGLLAASAEAHHRLDSQLVSHFNELRSICTPEQQGKLTEVFLRTLRDGGPPPPGDPPSGR